MSSAGEGNRMLKGNSASKCEIGDGMWRFALAAVLLVVSWSSLSAEAPDASQRTDSHGGIFHDRFELYRWIDWHSPALIDGREGNGLAPRVVLEGRVAVAIWRHGPVDDYRVFIASSSDGGVSWGNPGRFLLLQHATRRFRS